MRLAEAGRGTVSLQGVECRQWRENSRGWDAGSIKILLESLSSDQPLPEKMLLTKNAVRQERESLHQCGAKNFMVIIARL